MKYARHVKDDMSNVRGWRKGDEAPHLCESCNASSLTAPFKPPAMTKYEDGEALLCELCASTFIGNAFFYPNQYDSTIYKTMAQIAHWLNDQAIQREKSLGYYASRIVDLRFP